MDAGAVGGGGERDERVDHIGPRRVARRGAQACDAQADVRRRVARVLLWDVHLRELRQLRHLRRHILQCTEPVRMNAVTKKVE